MKDIDSDGDLDIVVPNRAPGANRIYINDGELNFTQHSFG
ncbi:MAG: VCBS repeat-containing protein [Chitinophagales bacterium]|nr:VCBS repeat-containing protein [Chitinophagales bacterium]